MQNIWQGKDIQRIPSWTKPNVQDFNPAGKLPALQRASSVLLYIDRSADEDFYRTLDQSYFHMLGDTTARDKDQVVSRWASCEKHGSTRRPHNMLMVDQLWLWLIKSSDRNEPDTIISSFPSRSGIDSTTRQVDDIQGTVLKKSANRSPLIDSSNFISLRATGSRWRIFTCL